MGRGNDVASGEKLAQGPEAIESVIHHLLEESGSEPQGRHAVAGYDVAQLRDTGDAERSHDEATAVEQRAPDLERRDVERERGELQNDFVTAETRVACSPDQTDDVPVCHRDALGLAGGA